MRDELRVFSLRTRQRLPRCGPMRRVHLAFIAAALLLIESPRADAQASPPASGAPSTPLPSAIAEDDPMLAPIAPPPHQVSNWQEALSSLKARSTDLKIALAEVERSQGQWREALAASLPTITATGNVTGNLLRQNVCGLGGICTTIPDAASAVGTLTVSQPILALRAWNSAGTAKVTQKIAELSAEDQKRLLTIALANAVVSVVTAERLSEMNRIGLRAALDRLALARRKVALGAGNALDTVRAEQDVAVVRSAIVTGDESLRKAREALGLALGSTEPWGVPVDIDLNGLEASAQASCGAAATLDERADIAAAQKGTVVAKRNIDDAYLQFSPTINVVSSFNAASAPFANGLREAWTISGVLTFLLRRRVSLRRAARHPRPGRSVAATSRGGATQRDHSDKPGPTRVDVAEKSRRVSEGSRDLARETERLSRVAFQLGTGTSLDLIESGRRLREAESQLALQEFGLVQARIAALLALSRCHW